MINKGKTASGAGGARTHDRRIMRSTATCTVRTTCTDTTEPCRWRPWSHWSHRRLGPRTGPRIPWRSPDASYRTSPPTARLMLWRGHLE